MRYAQILNDVVHCIIESNIAPVFAKDIILVDITDYKNIVKIGDLYQNGKFTTPDRTDEQMQKLRSIRDELLVKSDWTQLIDNKLNDDQRIAWRGYRQALRDFPTTVTDIFNPVWPVAPA